MTSKVAGRATAADGDAAARMEMTADGFASIKEAEKYLSVCRTKIYALMDAGELKYAKIGKSRRIPWAVLRSYAAGQIVG